MSKTPLFIKLSLIFVFVALSRATEFGGKLETIREYQYTGWTGDYKFTPSRSVNSGTCLVTLDANVQYFHITNAGLLMFLAADYKLPKNQFRLIFNRVGNVPEIKQLSFVEINIIYYDNAKFGSKGIHITCDDEDYYRYGVRSFPITTGITRQIQSSFIDAGVDGSGFKSWLNAEYVLRFPYTVNQFKIYDTRLQNFKNEGNVNFTVYGQVPKDLSEVLFYWDYGSNEFQGIEIIIDDGVIIEPTEEPTTQEATTTSESTTLEPTTLQCGHQYLTPLSKATI